ncbi:hypothetical protein NE235_34365 [Actinoallomurus spadix]|uniref:Integral membrane protein n=1 Tax=Actinoallomurus spadix TaxID=79912 RepID=A0ABN0VPM3_9ACTN|nr:hypothetical protein [Actinoallomurus spadix]MCO5991209.1 hypothetical protein [Actinoallomurus spadix]
MMGDSAAPAGGVGARWSAARRIAGYGAALSMGSYLVVKVIWVVAAFVGHAPEGFGTADWVTLNAVTVAMAMTGAGLGLALAQRWGRRLPAVPVVLFSWVGAGFLVPMIPYLVATGLLGASGAGGGGAGDDSDPAPGWETVMITVGFTGMALGLAVALPIYLRERWPRAFLGRLRGGEAGARSLITAAIAVAAGLGVLWSFWGLGGTLGLDPAHRDHWDSGGRLLNATWGMWALIGAWSGWALTRGRPGGLRLWLPMSLAFAASGSLFAWGGWLLVMVILRPGGFTPAEYTGVAVAEHVLGVALGVTLLTVVRRVVVRAADPAAGGG